MRIRVTAKRRTAVGDSRCQEPITFGVPFPRSSVFNVGGWRFFCGADPIARPVQARVLDRWADGSARWVLVDTQATLAAPSSSDCYIDTTTGQPAAQNRPTIRTTESVDGLTIDTGACLFVLRTGDSFPFDRVERAGKAMVRGGGGALTVTDAHGSCHRANIRTIRLEEPGELRCCVRLNGSVSVGAADKTLELSARIHFFAGLPLARVLVTLTNPNAAKHKGGFWDLGDPGSILVEDAVMTLPLANTAGSVLRVSPEVDMAFASVATPVEIYQDSSGGERWQSTNHFNRNHEVPISFRGYRARLGDNNIEGLRATPALAIETGDVLIAAAVPQFWQRFPKALEASNEAIRICLLPSQYADVHEIQAGEQLTQEVFVAFGDDGVSSGPLDWCRNPTIACVDSDWCIASGAVPFLAPLDDKHAALVNSAIEGPHSFEAKREVVDEYGWRHFGEIYGDHEAVRQPDPPLVSHYNNQYDPIAGFALQFLRTGDVRWRAMMDDLARHVIDIDVYHTDRDKWAYNRGLFWHTYHYGDADTATHRTYPRAGRGHTHGGGPSADHNYTTGLMLHYFLTGNEASRQTVIDLANYVFNLDDGTKTVFRWLDRGDTGGATRSADHYGPGRSPANSVNALLDAHHLAGEPRMLDKAEQLIGRVVHPEEDIARHRLSNTELRWFYTMFLQSLGKYLNHKIELGELDRMYGYGRATLLHYARWMVRHEHPYLDYPDKLEFPTETWAAQDIRKSDVFLYAAMHASGTERARFIERARFYYHYSLETLAKMPTHTLARPVVVLLTSGFLSGWFAVHQDVTAPAPAGMFSFGAPQSFVPQRKRAERRAVVIAGVGLLGFVLAIAALLLR